MTPIEMARVLNQNIEITRALMEDGPAGYVLHDNDNMRFICVRGGAVRLGNPQDDDVAVHTSHARAVTMQRYWNSNNPDTLVAISLRREAMQAYLDRQQRALDTLLTMIDFTQRSK